MRSQSNATVRVPRAEGAWTDVPRGFRPLLRLLSPAGERAKLTTLIFHRVRPKLDALFPNEMHAATFRDRLRWVSKWFNVLALAEAIGALGRGTLPERALAITFDDGYADNFEVALPILQEYGLPATFFIATGFLDGGRMWNDTVIEAIRRTSASSLDLSTLDLGVYAIGSNEARRQAIGAVLAKLKYVDPDLRLALSEGVASLIGTSLPDNLMMTREQVRGLAASRMGIGAHTVTHPILTRVDVRTARQEIMDGRDALEEIIGQPIRLFAYPNGRPAKDYGAEHVRIVRDLGFSAAVSTAAGAARAGESVFELPRFTPWDASARRWGWRLARNLLVSAERAAA